MKWTTKDGVIMEVEDMDKDHAYNTIQMLLRNNKPQVLLECLLVGRKKLLDDIESKNTFKLNGDMAQEFNDTMHEADQDYLPIDLQDSNWYKEGF